MAKISRVLRSAEDGGLLFRCPGCEKLHQVKVGGGQGTRWSWNADPERPTFAPSILVSWTEWTPSAETPEILERIRSGKIAQRPEQRVCHSFVREGRIEFLGDCTHSLAGQTVDMPDVE